MTDSTSTPVASSEPLDDEAEARLLEGKIIGERYQIEKLLGVGGMGAVYRALHVHMRKRLALKVLHRSMAGQKEVIQRFEREAVASGRIDHPNVARATDFGLLEDGSFFLVLEYVDGTSLREVLAQQGAMSPERAIRIARQIASALAAAHAHNIVHRDLKPENVMLVAGSDEPDLVKVLDFGIAKISGPELGAALTRVGMVFGTPHYMSPEQALGHTVDARTDLYSLGIMLHEMLTGLLPFDAEEQVTVLTMQITAPPPPLGDHVPAELQALVRSLLAKSASNRPQSAKEVIDELDAILPPRSASLMSLSRPDLSAIAAVAAARAASSPLLVVPAHAATSPGLGYSDTDAPPPPTPAAPMVQSGPAHGAATLADIQALAKHEVRLGNATIPAWMLLAAGSGALVMFLIVVLGIVLTISVSGDAAEPAAASDDPTAVESPKNAPAPPKIATGELSKEIERLEAIPLYQRTGADWTTLARSYSRLERHKDAMNAYRAAISLDRSLRNDPQVLSDFRRAAASPDALSIVINLCESRRILGEVGLDLLWDIWLSLRNDPDKAASADTVLKKLVILGNRGASSQLQAAIALQDAQTCKKVEAALTRAAKNADSRASERLKQLESTKGCGPDGSQDCWPCIRGSELLPKAIAQASRRRAPKLEDGYRQ